MRQGIAAVTEDDYDELCRFLAASFVGRGDPDFWLRRIRIWWDLNPAFGAATARGWLLLEEDRIVGFFGNIPSLFQMAGEEVVASSAVAWYVVPEHRNKGAALFFNFLKEAAPPLFDTTPSVEVVQILKAANFKRLPWGQERRSFVVLRGGKLIGQRLPYVGSVGAALLGPALRLWQWARLNTGKTAGRYVVRRLQQADAAFDRLWERTRQAYAHTNVRTARVVDWYCFAEDIHLKVLLGVYFGDLLVGYAVFWTYTSDYRVLECLDLWLEETHAEAIGPLIEEAGRQARAEDCDLLTFPWFSDSLGSRLRGLGLFDAEAEMHNYYRLDDRGNGIFDAEASYFVKAQGDYGL